MKRLPAAQEQKDTSDNHITLLRFNIQALLDREGKTRYWLVKQMETDYATVNKICDNISKAVRLDILNRLMQALGCEVQDLFTTE